MKIITIQQAKNGGYVLMDGSDMFIYRDLQNMAFDIGEGVFFKNKTKDYLESE